jgi:DNA polymerase III subunit delta'
MPFADVLGQPHAVAVLRRGLAGGRLHHALLFVGPDGVGKELAAFALACAIVCKQRPGEGCGSCEACRKTLSRTEGAGGGGVPLHPDVVVVERGLYGKESLGRSTDEKTDISVDQIRRVVLDRVSIPPNEAPQRIVIVRRAEEMNASAANALLKTLEEPPLHTRFVLLTARPGELLPTIRSRTLPLRFAPLVDELVERILVGRGVDATRARSIAPLAGGSVETALSLADPEASEAREAAVAKLRGAARAPLATVLEATSSYANTGEDRVRLRGDLAALAATEATELRKLVLGGAEGRAIDEALRRYATAMSVDESLEKNANVPLALEAGWLSSARR